VEAWVSGAKEQTGRKLELHQSGPLPCDGAFSTVTLSPSIKIDAPQFSQSHWAL
jgi:hypothetical protein